MVPYYNEHIFEVYVFLYSLPYMLGEMWFLAVHFSSLGKALGYEMYTSTLSSEFLLETPYSNKAFCTSYKGSKVIFKIVYMLLSYNIEGSCDIELIFSRNV